MNFINNFIQQRAAKTYADHEFVKEYGYLITLVLLAKLTTAIFSIYAGYFFFKNLFVEILNEENLSIVFTWATLILLELLTNLNLSKFFKTSLRGRIKSAIGFLLLSSLFFAASFYTSSNGLAQRQAQKSDNSGFILAKFNVQIKEFKRQAEIDKTQLLKAIATIEANPSGWRGGKRNILQPWQLKEIAESYNKIEAINNTLRSDLDKIETEKKQELQTNKGDVLMVEKRFYRTVTIVMVIQFIINGLLMFFYSKIYHEKYIEEMAQEHVARFASDVSGYTNRLIETNISNQYTNYITALNTQLSEIETKARHHLKKTDDKKDKSIGFKKTNEIPYKIDSMSSDKNDSKMDDTDNIRNASNDIRNEVRTCKQCSKTFIPYNIKHIFCSDACRLTWHKEVNGFDLDRKLRRK